MIIFGDFGYMIWRDPPSSAELAHVYSVNNNTRDLLVNLLLYAYSIIAEAADGYKYASTCLRNHANQNSVVFFQVRPFFSNLRNDTFTMAERGRGMRYTKSIQTEKV